MELLLKRRWFTNQSTIGCLYVNNLWEAYTLEDVVRDVKIPGETAIPEGRYRVMVTWSNRFQRRMPLVCDVPGFEGIRIHIGNIPEETEGCILVGLERGIDRIWKSRLAFDSLFEKLDRCQAYKEEMWMEVTKG